MPAKLKAGQRRSKNEVWFEQGLTARGIKYSYEPETVVLIPERIGTLGKVSQTTYTPDYRLEMNDQIIYIEVKGYARAEDLLKSKIADIYFTNRKFKYVMVGHFGTLSTGLREYYPYSAKARITTIEKNFKKGKIVKRAGKLLQKYMKKGAVYKIAPAPVPKTIWEVLEELSK